MLFWECFPKSSKHRDPSPGDKEAGWHHFPPSVNSKENVSPKPLAGEVRGADFLVFATNGGSKNGVLEVGRFGYNSLEGAILLLERRQASNARADIMI